MRLLTGDRDGAARAFEVSAELGLLGADGAVTPVERLRVLDGLADRLPADHPALVLRRTVLRLEAGFVDEALAGVEMLRAGGALDAATKIELAGLLARRGRSPPAKQLYEEVLGENTASRGARTGLVQVLLEEGDLDAARWLLDEGHVQEPHLARYRVLLARLEGRQGDAEAALRWLDEAVELAPWETDWRLELAGLLVAEGHRRRAAEVLAEAPEGHPAIERFRLENGLRGER
jgi:tetratricopeptide (TPR) repeat protein